MVVNQKETCTHSSIIDTNICECGEPACACDDCGKCLCQCHTVRELVDALEVLTHNWDTVDEDSRPEGMTQALAAIAKAKGEV